jgi:hypothetical protein
MRRMLLAKLPHCNVRWAREDRALAVTGVPGGVSFALVHEHPPIAPIGSPTAVGCGPVDPSKPCLIHAACAVPSA